MNVRRINLHKITQNMQTNSRRVALSQTKPRQYTPKNNEPCINNVNEPKYDLERFTQLYRRFCEMEIETIEIIYRVQFSPEQKEKLIQKMLKNK